MIVHSIRRVQLEIPIHEQLLKVYLFNKHLSYVALSIGVVEEMILSESVFYSFVLSERISSKHLLQQMAKCYKTIYQDQISKGGCAFR